MYNMFQFEYTIVSIILNKIKKIYLHYPCYLVIVLNSIYRSFFYYYQKMNRDRNH